MKNKDLTAHFAAKEKEAEMDCNEKLKIIEREMRKLLLASENGKYRPVKNTTKDDCYAVLGKIQELLETNKFGMDMCFRKEWEGKE